MSIVLEYLESLGGKDRAREIQAQIRWDEALYYDPGLPEIDKIYTAAISKDKNTLYCLLFQNTVNKSVKIGIPHTTIDQSEDLYNMFALMNRSVLGQEKVSQYQKLLNLLSLKDRKNKKKLIGPNINCYQPKLAGPSQALIMCTRITTDISRFEEDLLAFDIKLEPLTPEKLLDRLAQDTD